MAPKMEPKWSQNGSQTHAEASWEGTRSLLKNRRKNEWKSVDLGGPKETPFGAILGFDRGSKKKTIGACVGHASGFSRGGLGEPPGKVRILRS